MRKVKVSTRDLLFAMDNRMPGTNHYLDTRTGEVIPVFSFNQVRVMEQVHAEPDRFIRLAPRTGRRNFEVMKSFIATVTDPDLATRLDRTLESEHAFRDFRAELKNDLRVSARWQRYRAEELTSELRKKLSERDIQLELIDGSD